MVGKAHAGFTPSLTGSKPVVILAVGSGARPGENVMRSLGDSLHLIFLNPAKKRAVLVGVPRDSYVPIPGHGTGKINSSMFYGGPDLMVQTMEQNFGVTIDYWALTTFWGFTAMIDDGRRPHGRRAVPDGRLVLRRRTSSPACRSSRATEALAFSRDRHSLEQGDFGRQENGGRLMLASLPSSRSSSGRSGAAVHLARGGHAQHRHRDPALGGHGPRVHRLEGARRPRCRTSCCPAAPASIGGLSVVTLDMARARAIVADAKRRRHALQEERATEPHRGRVSSRSG